MFDTREGRDSLAAARAGDVDAIEVVAQTLTGWLRGELRRRKIEDGEELRARFVCPLIADRCRRLPELAPGLLVGYLRKRLEYLLTDRLRQHVRRQGHESLFCEMEARALAELASPLPGPEQAALARERREVIAAAVKQMDATNRLIFQYYFEDERKEGEVAATLGLPVGTVSSRIHTIRVHLQEVLAEYLR